MEILSEATYRAFCATGTLRDPAAFDTWMCTILVRCSYTFLKQRSRFVAYEDTQEASSGDESELTDLRLDVYRLMDGLSTEERTLLILRFFEERSLEEIADIMEMSLSTVKSKLYRSLTKMRNMEQEADSHV